MMVAVFLMQPVGQFISQLVAYGVLLGYSNTYDLRSCYRPEHGDCGKAVDSIWRWVAGAGAIPAVVAIIFRFQIDDPGLYDLDVRDEGTRAVQNTMVLYRYRRLSTQMPSPDAPTAADVEMHQLGGGNDNGGGGGGGNMASIHQHEPPLPKQFSREDMWDYFITQGNWRSLAGTSMCWFLLDM